MGNSINFDYKGWWNKEQTGGWLSVLQRSTTSSGQRFNSMERALQMAVLLIREEAGSHARADAFLASQLEWQQ